VYSDIVVSGISPLSVIDNVKINITHTFDGDLAIYLVDPLNNEHLIVNHRGGSGDNFVNTIFKNTASTSISVGAAPFTGTYIPETSLPHGVNPNGTWRLHVIDGASGDVGTINNWYITFVAPPCPTVGIHTSPSGITSLTCRDSIYIYPNDSAVAGGADYPTLYFQFNTGANGAKNAVTIYEDGAVIYQAGYGAMDINTELTVYFPGPGASPSSNYTIQVCNQDGTAPMPWVVYDGNGTTYASGSTATGCTTYGPWHPAGTFTWTISPAASGLYYASWGAAGFWADESGPGNYTITYNWDNQGTGSFHCTGSASINMTVSNPWNASWNSPGTICASGGSINLAGYITGNTGGTWSGTGVSGNIFNPSGLSGSINITYTVGNSAACQATQSHTITVTPLATANAGSDASICSGSTYTISGASYGGSATGCSWSSSGSGSFTNGSTTAPTYTPSAADISTGHVTLTMTTTGSCASASDAMVLTINALPNASFSYGSGSFCKTGTNPTPSVSTSGGTFTSLPSGLSINSSTGTIDLTLSTIGTYTITYSIGGACPNSSTASITITNGFDAQFSYTGPYCQSGSNPLPSHTTGSNGTYSSVPSGVIFVNTNTGEINLSATPYGSYTIINTIPASGGCGQATYSNSVTIDQAPTVSAGADATICSNTSYHVSGANYGGSASSISWTSSGNGSLVNANSLTPTYTPSASDISNGSVVLTATTNDPSNSCQAVSDQMTLFINQASVVHAGTTQTICEGNVVYLNGTMSGGTTNTLWTSSGNGNFSNNSSLTTTYTPSANDIQIGHVYLFITGNDPDGSGPCSVAVDSIYIQLNKAATINAGNDASICAGDHAPVSATLGGSASTIVWTTTGSGTFLNSTVPSTSYIPSANDISAGSVHLIATTNDPDGSGPCSQSIDSILLTIHPLPVITNIATTPVNNCQSPNGSITITATSPLTPLTYSIDAGQNFSSDVNYTNLNAGVYTVVVQNAAGCTSSQSVTIQNTQGPQITSVEAHNPLCFGQTNGQIVVHTNGSNYHYTINGGSQTTDSVFTNLAPGTYNILVVDNGGCQAQSQVTLTGPTILQATTFKQNIQCFGAQNGSLSISVQGGTGSYSYLWNNTAITSSINNLSAGIYLVTVTDQNGCTLVKADTITQPSLIIISLTTTNPTCYNSQNGSISSSVSGGVPNYMYTWSTTSSAPSVSNLSGGTYTLTITDSNGCTQTSSTIVNEPQAITSNPTVNQISCFGLQNGTIQLSISGGISPYTYTWSNQSSSSIISNLTAGVYSVTVTDHNLCSSNYSFTITQPNELVVSHPQSGVLCNGSNNGFINLSVEGGTPAYSYYWSNGSHAASLQNLSSGAYSYTVTDANNCQQTAIITIHGSTAIVPVIQVDATTQQASITTTGGTPAYTYLWSNQQTDSVITLTLTGLYTATITDANGCTATVTYNNDVPLKIPTCITPNGDHINDDFEITNIVAYPKLSIEIYNRWGDLLFLFDGTGAEYASSSNRWNGKYKGKDLPMGAYLYIINLFNNKDPLTGTVSIIK
jgi:gliding motility-associated-like protein